MAGKINEAAPHHLPPFITAPGETDVLYVGLIITVLLVILMIGNFYFKLHALPERMAHGSQSTQFQLVGILALLALFTHNNLFWVAALLIAALKLPDYSTPLYTIADAVTGLVSRGDKLEPAPERGAGAAPNTHSGEPAHDTETSAKAAGPVPDAPSDDPPPTERAGPAATKE